ncbi:MAG: hypothetical protein NVSMB57_11970 [Actinomycetota bacterium]
MREGALGETAYRVREKAETIPVLRAFAGAQITNVLIGINVAVFALTFLAGRSASAPNPLRHGELLLPLPRTQLWRMFTAMFLHLGVLHIAFNMYALVVFGRSVEMRYGKARFLGLYIASGLLGSGVSLAFHQAPFFGVGASGAIYGVLGGLFGFVVSNRHLPGSLQMLQRLAFIVVLNFVLGLRLNVDFYAHMGGLVGGFLIAVVFELEMHRRMSRRKTAALAFGACFLVAAVAVGIALPKTCSSGAPVSIDGTTYACEALANTPQ